MVGKKCLFLFTMLWSRTMASKDQPNNLSLAPTLVPTEPADEQDNDEKQEFCELFRDNIRCKKNESANRNRPDPNILLAATCYTTVHALGYSALTCITGILFGHFAQFCIRPYVMEMAYRAAGRVQADHTLSEIRVGNPQGTIQQV